MAGEIPQTDKGWQTYLAHLKPDGTRKWLAMGNGLTVHVGEAGAKTFQARIRRAGDTNPRRIAIGHFPAVSVAEARKRLAEAKAEAKEGRDPAVEHRRRRAGVEDVRTLSVLVDVYLARRAEEGGLRAKTVEIETSALRGLKACLGDRLLSDLAAKDIATVIQKEAVRLRRRGGTGRSANIMLAATKRMFKRARGWGLMTGPNPAADLARPAQEAARDRVLHDPIVVPSKDDPGANETGRFLAALRNMAGLLDLEHETRVALYLTLALGLRASETVSLARADIDLSANTVKVRTSKTAAGVRTLPLPTQVAETLRALLVSGDGRRRFLFPARSDAKRAEHLHRESLSRACARACAALKIKGATLHDLRRTCLTGIIELTGDHAIAERIAGHKGRSTLARHYDRSRRLEPMRAALQAWADALEAAIGEATFQSSNWVS